MGQCTAPGGGCLLLFSGFLATVAARGGAMELT